MGTPYYKRNEPILHHGDAGVFIRLEYAERFRPHSAEWRTRNKFFPCEMTDLSVYLESTGVNSHLCTDLNLPGRGRGGGRPHLGCAVEKGGSTLCAAASSPAFPPESPLQSPPAPPVSGSTQTTHTRTEQTLDVTWLVQDQTAKRVFWPLGMQLVFCSAIKSYNELRHDIQLYLLSIEQVVKISWMDVAKLQNSGSYSNMKWTSCAADTPALQPRVGGEGHEPIHYTVVEVKSWHSRWGVTFLPSFCPHLFY